MVLILAEEDLNKIDSVLQDIFKEETDVKPQDYFTLASETYDTFNEEAYNRGKGYGCPEFPIFDKKIEGLLPGLYFFAARSNTGKTAFMTNLMWNYCKNPENHLFGVYYSLDDSCNDVIPRLMSMLQQIPISVCSKPKRYLEELNRLRQQEPESPEIEEYETYLEKRDIALRQLKEMHEHFYIVDQDTIQNFEQLIQHAKQVQAYVKSKDPQNDIMICIDAVSDLQYGKKKFSSSDEKYRQISMDLRSLSNELNIVVFGSCHLKKRNDTKRPILDDLKDTGRFQYDASAVFMLYNDVSENKQNASIFYGESPDVQPIIEMDWAKNKKSSFKGRSYYYFVPDFSLIQECSPEDMKRYDALLYSN